MNPNAMMCPAWNGVDTSGRAVCDNSYFTKREGCNSAADRVLVENDLRPQYIEYINLDASGIRGQGCGMAPAGPDTQCHQRSIKDIYKQTGQFGLNSGFSQNIFPNCVKCNTFDPNSNSPPIAPTDSGNSSIVEKYIKTKNELKNRHFNRRF
jgi:hypothetical protein